MKRWLSFGEISEELGISLQSLYFYNRSGTGPKAYKFGKHYRVLEKDLVLGLLNRNLMSDPTSKLPNSLRK